jgi:hypothetical protein
MARPDASDSIEYSYAEQYEMRLEIERKKKPPSLQEILNKMHSGIYAKWIEPRDLLEGLDKIYNR